jgi:hypothetical protein
MIDSKKEYGFVWSEEYQREVDTIINCIIKEYPLTINKINDARLGFEVHCLLLHSINLSRQLNSIGSEQKRKKIKGD